MFRISNWKLYFPNFKTKFNREKESLFLHGSTWHMHVRCSTLAMQPREKCQGTTPGDGSADSNDISLLHLSPTLTFLTFPFYFYNLYNFTIASLIVAANSNTLL